MLGARASEMTREIFVEVLREAIKEELRKLPELSVLVAQTAKELSEDMRLSLQIEELIAARDKKRESRKSDLLASLLAASKGGSTP